MTDFAAMVGLISALADVVDGPFRRLRAGLGALTDLAGPTVDLFTIGQTDGPDAGLAVGLAARRADGRLVSWQVEVWIHSTRPGEWAAEVKAEIDLDDQLGDDRCVLNEQTVVTDSAQLARAVHDAAVLVVAVPLEQLLTDGWEPPGWTEPSVGT